MTLHHRNLQEAIRKNQPLNCDLDAWASTESLYARWPSSPSENAGTSVNYSNVRQVRTW